MRGWMFVATLMEGGEFKYLGNGVKVGEAEKVVCYFRKKGAERYGAIYGDLRVGELSAEEVAKLGEE